MLKADQNIEIFNENYDKPTHERGYRFSSSMWESYSHSIIFYNFIYNYLIKVLGSDSL